MNGSEVVYSPSLTRRVVIAIDMAPARQSRMILVTLNFYVFALQNKHWPDGPTGPD
jgi:hypothetical protein